MHPTCALHEYRIQYRYSTSIPYSVPVLIVFDRYYGTVCTVSCDARSQKLLDAACDQTVETTTELLECKRNGSYVSGDEEKIFALDPRYVHMVGKALRALRRCLSTLPPPLPPILPLHLPLPLPFPTSPFPLSFFSLSVCVHNYFSATVCECMESHKFCHCWQSAFTAGEFAHTTQPPMEWACNLSHTAAQQQHHRIVP